MLCIVLPKKPAASGKKVQALLYREGYSGRIAAMYHNDVKNFGAHSYTLIPKDGYRELFSEEGAQQAREVFCASDVNRGEGGRALCRSDALRLRLNFTFALQNVQHFTLLQSEDPGWFLARSFQFTSRTTYSFLSSFCRNFDSNMSGLANNLRGRQLDYGAHRLPNDYTEVTNAFCTKWDIVLDTIKMRKSTQQANNPRADALTQLRQSTSASLTVLRKEDLLSMLTNLGYRQSSSLRKQQLVENFLELQGNERCGRISITPLDPETVPENERRELDSKIMKTEMLKASLDTWFMKPLSSTPGMKEGSFNERQVLTHLPAFFEKNPVSDARQQLGTLFQRPSDRFFAWSTLAL